MIPSNSLLRSLLLLAAVAADAAAQSPALSPNRRAELTSLSQRLIAGDTSAIDELLACTRPASADPAPSSAEIERLRAEVERLRGAQPAAPAVTAAPAARPATARDAEAALREARAWLRAGDPNHCLKALPVLDHGTSAANGTDAGDGEALYRQACALERLGRDEEALEAYRRAAAGSTSPFLKLGAASGVDHIEWRLRRAGKSEAKP